MKTKLSTAEVIKNAEEIFHGIRWKNGIVVCPYCGSIHIKEYDGYKYKCNHCKNRFSDRTKTLMHGSKLSIGVWMQAIYEMMVDNFISSNVLAVKLGINQKSAWLLQTKLRYSMEQDRWLLEGVIAQDEAYIGGCLSNYHYSRKWDLLRKGRFIEGNIDRYTKSEIYALNASLKQPVFGMNDGNKVVLALRKSRHDKLTDIITSKLYAKIIQKLALKNMPDNGVDSYLIDRQVIDFLVNLNQNNAPLTELILWSGYEYASVYYDRAERKIGKSSWTLSKKIKMSFDSLFGFSYVPIRFITGVGFLMFFVTMIWGFVLLIRKIIGNITIPGYTSTIIVVLFAFGIIMLSIGIIGEYVWRALDAAKRNPVFIIESVKNESRKK